MDTERRPHSPEPSSAPVEPASLKAFSNRLAQTAVDGRQHGGDDGTAASRAEAVWWNRNQEEHHRSNKFRNDRLEQDMQLRKQHAEKAVGLAQAAVVFWMFMFAMTAMVNVASGRPFLSDSALITLTAGATVNVIAVFLVVVKGLFPNSVMTPAPQERSPDSNARRQDPH